MEHHFEATKKCCLVFGWFFWDGFCCVDFLFFAWIVFVFFGEVRWK